MAVDVATSAFAGEPQPVEIYHRGIWYSGELLGWRHESDGRCLARVACVVGKLRHKAWKDLADLRLPEPGDGDASRTEVARPGDRRTDGVPPLDDQTRPHVLLADLRARPRTPAHAVRPPPPGPAAVHTSPRPRVPIEQMSPPRWTPRPGDRLSAV